MKKFRIIIFSLLALSLVLAGCQRSASKAPDITPGVVEENSSPLSVDDQILAATATADAIRQDFNMPTQLVPNAQGTQVAITAIPPTPIPSVTPTNQPTPTLLPLTRPTSWTIHGGETVFCIARRFDLDPDEILSMNGLNAYSMLQIGDVLQLPQSGSWTGGDRKILDHPDTWEVSSGETVYGIACAYGDVWPEHIIQANGLSEPYDLSGISSLVIP